MWRLASCLFLVVALSLATSLYGWKMYGVLAVFSGFVLCQSVAAAKTETRRG